MADWNSAQYLKFENERTQPSIDLANRIPVRDPKRIVDIGCGPGNSTNVLAQRFPNAHVLGVDFSQNMIDSARAAYPQLEFAICDASKDLPMLGDGFDIVFSNACIQWVPGHPKLLREMMALLNEGGILAVQSPLQNELLMQKIVKETAKREKWSGKFPQESAFYNLSQSEYYDLLSEISSDFSMWETVYYHSMKSHNYILEWYRSTGLRPYLNVLSEEEEAAFEKDILKEVASRYPVQKNGEVIFRFPRLFFIAVK